MRIFFLFLLSVFAHIAFAQNNMGIIRVFAVSEKTKITNGVLTLADVTIYTDSTEEHGSINTDGVYKSSGLKAGKYHIKVTYKGCQTKIIKNVVVLRDKTTYVNFCLSMDSTNKKKPDITEYKDPIIDPSTAHGGYVKMPFLPRLFFKPNSLNFDTLSNYFGNGLHIIDTNQVIDYMVKYMIDHPKENIGVAGYSDVNEQNPEELCKQRAEKVVNLLIQHGIPKKNIVDGVPYRRPIKTSKEIENASTENERQNLHKANRCVIFKYIPGG